MNDNLKAESFSNDPEENLRMENLFLQMKIKAELGGEFGNFTELSPQIANRFLRHVMEYEEKYRNCKTIKIAAYLGNPEFRKSTLIPDEEIAEELGKLIRRMQQRGIEVEFRKKYPHRLIYEFITEELFELETDDITLPGMIRCFLYEEFHPDHKLDIQDRVNQFFNNWHHRRIGEFSFELGDPFILPNATILSKVEVMKKFNRLFESHVAFDNWNPLIKRIEVEIPGGDKTNLGFAEGTISYDATLENKEQQHFEGPFKIYLSCENDWWSIFYFVMPGFEWRN